MLDRRLIHHFDWEILLLVFALGGIGLASVYSAVTADPPPAPYRGLFAKQILWCAIGLPVMAAAVVFPYRHLDRLAYPVYLGCLLLLIAVILFGKFAGGSRRWLVLGPLHLQPSELFKVAVVVVLARYYSRLPAGRALGFRDLLRPIALTAAPCGLIALQPDLGTACLIALVAATLTLFAGVAWRTLLAGAGALAGLLPVGWSLLKEYQRQRILTFLNPDQDPLGAGYHVIQSKIAIGSGLLTGKGYLQGTQNALSFLPEEHTDFIFSVLAEEWGALGSLAMLALFLLLILWGGSVAYRSRDPFGVFLAVGLTALIGWQVVINVGMTMGLLPVVGVPLPLISYGGSSTVAVAICIGLLLNVSMRRVLFE